MATIVPNQNFKHGRETFEAGESYEVSEEDALYFEEAGWVGNASPNNAQVNLEINDVMLGHSAEVN